MFVYLCCSDTERYNKLLDEIWDMYSFLQALVNRKEFEEHVHRDAYRLDNVEKDLKLRKADLMKTDCPVVFAGRRLCLIRANVFLKICMFK